MRRGFKIARNFRLAESETVETSAARCGIAHLTAFRWQHRFLGASRQDPETLRGIVEADERPNDLSSVRKKTHQFFESID